MLPTAPACATGKPLASSHSTGDSQPDAPNYKTQAARQASHNTTDLTNSMYCEHDHKLVRPHHSGIVAGQGHQDKTQCSKVETDGCLLLLHRCHPSSACLQAGEKNIAAASYSHKGLLLLLHTRRCCLHTTKGNRVKKPLLIQTRFNPREPPHIKCRP